MTLYLDCGGEYTTICICQNSENCTLKKGGFYSMETWPSFENQQSSSLQEFWGELQFRAHISLLTSAHILFYLLFFNF